VTLLETLTGGFGQGGFDLESSVGGLASSLGGVKPTGASIDTGQVGGIADRLGQADLGPIGEAVGGIAGLASTIGAGFPSAGDLLQPLQSVVGTAQLLTSSDTRNLVGTLEGAAAAGRQPVGLAGLAVPLRALEEARQGPIAATLRTVAGLVPGGLELEAPIAALGGQAGGVLALVQLLGGLMAIDTLTRGLGTSTAQVAAMLDADKVDAAIALVDSLATADLTAAAAAVDPDDEAAVAPVVASVVALAEALRAAEDVLVRGMAFGEATLVHAELPRLVSELGLASGVVDERALAPVRQLVLSLRARLDPLLQIDLGAPADSFDAYLAEVGGLVGEIAGAVDRLDPASLAEPLTRLLADLAAPLHRVEQVAEETRSAFQSAFQTIHQAIAAIDLRPVTEAIRAALQPAVDALAALQQLVGDAQQAIEQASQETVKAIGDVKKSLGDAATTVHDAYKRVADAIEALNLDQLEDDIRDGIAQAVQALHAAQLKPYFDASTDVMTTAADIVSKVPVDLLPDDAKQDLEQAVAPIKEIDFDTAIKQVLEGQLDEILRTLDTDVLDEVTAAYKQVVDFLEEINPRPAFQELEREAFDPLVDRLKAIDVAALFEPVENVLDELKDAVRSFDLERDVLKPLDDAFQELRDAFAGLDPAVAVAPIVKQVDELRESVEAALQLDEWLKRLDAAVAFVDDLLGRLDFDGLVGLLDGAWDSLRPSPGRHVGVSSLGTLLGSLIEGTGLPVRADAFATVAAWIGGADAAAQVKQRLDGAVAALEAARTAAEHADLQPLVGRLQPFHRELVAAVETHPAESLLRTRLDPLLAAVSPVELLGANLDNRARYLGELDEPLAAVRGAAGSGRSELGAVTTGLREAFRPLQAAPDKVRALFARFGVDVDGRDLREILRGLFDRLEPSVLLAPLTTTVAALKGKVAALVRDGLVGPVRQAISDVKQLLATLDLGFLTTELKSLHDELLADIDQLKPSTLLADVIASVQQTQETILGFDPLGAARAAVDAMKQAIEELVNDFRPTKLFGPILDVYDHILKIARGLDVKNLLEPILTALDDIKAQLDEGLDRTADALDRLQAALP
jgi:hypothetical protein